MRRPNAGPLLLFALLLGLLLGVQPVRAQEEAPSRPNQAETLSLEAYRARLAAALAGLEADGDPAHALAAAQEDLARVEAVTLASGESMPLLPLLDGVTEPEIARARLRTAAAQIERAAGDDLAQRQALLAALLAGPQFQARESVWDRFWRWLESLLERRFPRLGDAVEGDAGEQALNIVGWAVVAAGAALLVALLAWWLRRLLAGFVADAELRRRLAAGETLPLTAAEARRQAGAQARAGSYREAVRSLYLAALLSLEERQAVVHDRTLTNRELLARTEQATPLRAHLAPVVQTFDRVWYGVSEPDAATYTAYVAEVDALLAETGAPAQGQPPAARPFPGERTSTEARP